MPIILDSIIIIAVVRLYNHYVITIIRPSRGQILNYSTRDRKAILYKCNLRNAFLGYDSIYGNQLSAVLGKVNCFYLLIFSKSNCIFVMDADLYGCLRLHNLAIGPNAYIKEPSSRDSSYFFRELLIYRIFILSALRNSIRH